MSQKYCKLIPFFISELVRSQLNTKKLFSQIVKYREQTAAVADCFITKSENMDIRIIKNFFVHFFQNWKKNCKRKLSTNK